MLRFPLLLLFWTFSSLAFADLGEEAWLPRPGQSLEIWNADLTRKLGHAQATIERNEALYTLRADGLPLLHFLCDDQRFSIPGVAATGQAETFDEQGVRRHVYRGSQLIGTLEKSALIELARLDEGRCQLSWKLSVINRGEKLRHQEGSIAYDCRIQRKKKMQGRGVLHLLPGQDFSKR